MNAGKWIVTAVAISAAAALTAWAVTQPARTFRTTAALLGYYQSGNVAQQPQYGVLPVAGHDIVNFVLGAEYGTARTNEVLAIAFDCPPTSATMVVWDKTGASNLAVVATSTSIDTVVQQDPKFNFPDRARFVAQMQVQPGGSVSNALLGGFLTVAGRLYLGSNGCPHAILKDTDTKSDSTLGDGIVKNNDDKEKLVEHTGEAHVIGVVDVIVFGSTNTVLVPEGRLNFSRQLSP